MRFKDQIVFVQILKGPDSTSSGKTTAPYRYNFTDKGHLF